MSFDDPFKQVRDLNRQFESNREIFREFDRMRELTASPLEEMNAVLKLHRFAYELPEVDVSRILQEAMTLRPIAQELIDISRAAVPDLQSELASLSPLQEQIAESWKNYQQFYDGLVPTNQFRDLLEESRLAEVLSLARVMKSERLDPIGNLQQAVQESLREAESLQKSLPVLQLEENLAYLKSVTDLPEIASGLTQIAKGLGNLTQNALPPVDLFASMRSAADTLRLPYLEAAAAQWTAMLPTLSPASLVSETLLQATISAVSSAASYRGATTLDPLISEWEAIVASEESKHEDGRLPDWMQGFLLNLLFFMMSLAAQNESESRINEKLRELSEGQSDIVETVEVSSEGKNESTLETSENQTVELAAMRQRIEETAELLEEETEADSAEQVLYASDVLRLRELPALGSKILWKIPKGTAVEVVEEQGDWSSVRVKDFAIGKLRVGWASNQYLVEWDELDIDSAANPLAREGGWRRLSAGSR